VRRTADGLRSRRRRSVRSPVFDRYSALDPLFPAEAWCYDGKVAACTGGKITELVGLRRTRRGVTRVGR
jgi:hypothetical protein